MPTFNIDLIRVVFYFAVVLCTAPWKYCIIDPEGSIKPHSCLDVVLRHNSVIPSCYDATDKLRIQMSDYNSKQVLGKKDISVTLLPGRSATSDSPPSSSQDQFKQFTSDTQTLNETSSQYPSNMNSSRRGKLFLN